MQRWRPSHLEPALPVWYREVRQEGVVILILETDRLILRKMTQDDYTSLCSILQDADVMYAYAHAFSASEVQDWLDRQLRRYQDDGVGLWAVILKETGELIGQCGLTFQDCNGRQVLEAGYLFQKAFWHRGYATEAAAACRDYAFESLQADGVFSLIRDSNFPSQAVAKRNGMELRGQFTKHYYDIAMPHLIFSIRRQGCPMPHRSSAAFNRRL